MRYFFMKKKLWIILASAVLAVAAACGIYLSTGYSAIEVSLPEEVEVYSPQRGLTVFAPEEPAAGFIFYPGGKVEAEAYASLLAECARGGVLCVLAEMPFDLAVLNVNAADGVRELFPEIENWYIGGHSLGGAMASTYIGSHAEDFAGLVLLGAYSTVDLSGSELDVLLVYGSEDKVMNREKYDSGKANLPDSFTETVIEGGCHAYFGMYGEQDGDGKPTVTCEEQIYATADAIVDMINGTNKEK